jgi:hypothetical protein
MTATSLRTGALLVFDGDCGFCTTSIRWFERRFPDSFATTPYQLTDLEPLGLTERECTDKVQWIEDVSAPRTTRSEGARAVAAMVRHGGRSIGGYAGALWQAAGTVADVVPVSLLADVVYAAVAANRQRLPGGTPACAMPRAS